MFTRPQVSLDAQVRNARPGIGMLANFAASAQTADSAQTISVAKMAGGLYMRSGQTAGRTDTTDTAANILAANPDMDISDNFCLVVSNLAAQILTIAGGTDVTMGTKTTIAASSWAILVFTKTSATEMTCTIL